MLHHRLAPTILACSLVLGVTFAPQAAPAQSVVSVPTVSSAAGDTLDVPVITCDLTNLGVKSFRIWIRFDPTVLEYVSSPVFTGGVEFPGDTYKVASLVGDEVHVAASSSEPFSGSGCLFMMRFIVSDTAVPGACSPLEIFVADILPERPASFFDGAVCVGPPAQVSLSPQSDTVLVDQEHTILAEVDLGGAPAGDMDVVFEVLSGPNQGHIDVQPTNASGQATFSYTSASRGTDLVRVEVPIQTSLTNRVVSSVAAATWQRTPTDVDDYEGYGRTRFLITPNPFFESVSIAYTPRYLTASMVGSSRVDIYNARGQLVRSAPFTLFSGETLGFAWDGLDESSQRVSAGMYIVRARIPGQTLSTKVLRINASR